MSKRPPSFQAGLGLSRKYSLKRAWACCSKFLFIRLLFAIVVSKKEFLYDYFKSRVSVVLQHNFDDFHSCSYGHIGTLGFRKYEIDHHNQGCLKQSSATSVSRSSI